MGPPDLSFDILKRSVLSSLNIVLKRRGEEIEKATDGGKERKTKAEKDERAEEDGKKRC